MGNISLVTGGARSGKSRYVLDHTLNYAKRGFIATAIAMDDEMKVRIANHRNERKGYITVEEPLYLDKALEKLEDKVDVIIVDCITVWLGNLFFQYKDKEHRINTINNFFKKLENIRCDVLIVTNEVGNGIVPEHKLSRQFRDAAGRLNQDIACLADNVIMMVCGLPMVLKGSTGT